MNANRATSDAPATLDDHTITFERHLRAPVPRVWRAVTDPDELRAWFPSAIEGDRRVGAPLRFPFEGGEADTFTGEVVEWEPERVFAFTWGPDLLRIELTPDGDSTKLVFRQTIVHRSEAARTSSGWHVCLANLDVHLGGEGPPPGPDEWRALYADYLERMVPPLATVHGQVMFEWERMHFVSPERLWECLTSPAELSVWMEGPASIDLRLGGTVRFFEGKPSELEGVVVALEPGRRLAYTFKTIEVVEWEIEPTEHGTRFWLRQHGMDPADQAAGRAAGWHGFLAQLDVYLASGRLAVVDDWEARTADYQRLLDDA